jgi:hypothetical protein
VQRSFIHSQRGLFGRAPSESIPISNPESPYRLELACHRQASDLIRRCLAFMPVMLHMALRRFRRVMRGVVQMALRRMGMMRGRFVVPLLVVLRGFTVMSSCVLVVLGCLRVMFRCLLRHEVLLKEPIPAGPRRTQSVANSRSVLEFWAFRFWD